MNADDDGLQQRLVALTKKLREYDESELLETAQVRRWLEAVLQPPLPDGWYEYVDGYAVVSMRRGSGNWFRAGTYDPAVTDADMRERRARWVGPSQVAPGLSDSGASVC